MSIFDEVTHQIVGHVMPTNMICASKINMVFVAVMWNQNLSYQSRESYKELIVFQNDKFFHSNSMILPSSKFSMGPRRNFSCSSIGPTITGSEASRVSESLASRLTKYFTGSANVGV